MQGWKWFCIVDDVAMPYDDADAAVLENAFVQNQNGSAKVRGGSCEVNFTDMIQKTLASGYLRQVKRISGKVRV
jgi:hypothetical protein